MHSLRLTRASRSTRRYGICSRRSLGLEARELHHLGPLLGLVRDELAEIGGRAGKRRSAQVDKPRLDLGIGEASIDFLVELIDDLGGCVFRRSDAAPEARLDSPAGSRSRSGYPAAPPSALRSSPPARAVCPP